MLNDSGQQTDAPWLGNAALHNAGTVSLPQERIAFLLEGLRTSAQGKEILVRTATPAKCNDGGDYEASGIYSTAYKFPSLLPK
jgi:hypothetical protein